MEVFMWAQGTHTMVSGAGEPCLPPSSDQLAPWLTRAEKVGMQGEE